MRTNVVLVAAPGFDDDASLLAAAEPLVIASRSLSDRVSPAECLPARSLFGKPVERFVPQRTARRRLGGRATVDQTVRPSLVMDSNTTRTSGVGATQTVLYASTMGSQTPQGLTGTHL